MEIGPDSRIKDPADPKRCQGVTAHGQCQLVMMPDSKFCKMHGGANQAKAAERKRIRNYQVAKLRSELDRHTDSEYLKTLHEEIGITRLTLEAVLNKCDHPVDLIMHSNQIASMITQIERLVVSCHKLESSMGDLLDKQAVLKFADGVLDILKIYITDKEVLEAIGNDIVRSISND